MKKMIMILGLVISFGVFSDPGTLESHGNREQEKKCFKEIRSLACTGNDDAFIACVDKKMTELSVDCQSFHLDEKERMNHSH